MKNDEIVGKSGLEVCFWVLVATVMAIGCTGCSGRGYEFRVGFSPITNQDNRSGFEAPDLKRVRASRGAITSEPTGF